MKFYIENKSETESLLINGILKENAITKYVLEIPEKSPRYVLRPGETNNFYFNDEYIVGVEKL